MKNFDKPIKIKLSFRLSEENPQHPLGHTFFCEDGISYYVTNEGDMILPDDEGYANIDIEDKMISDITLKYLNLLISPGDQIEISEVGFCTYSGTNLGVISEPMLGIVIKDGIWTDYTGSKVEISNFEATFFFFNATRSECKELELKIKLKEYVRDFKESQQK